MTASSQSLAPKMNIAVLSALTDYILHPIPHLIEMGSIHVVIAINKLSITMNVQKHTVNC